MYYSIWVTTHDEPNYVWMADKAVVIADIRSTHNCTDAEAEQLLMAGTIDNPLKLSDKGYDVWIELHKVN